jgi:hypothetical protein
VRNRRLFECHEDWFRFEPIGSQADDVRH